MNAIVVARDGSGADIDALAHLRIPDIRQVIDFGGFSNKGLFDFHEVSDVHVIGKNRLGTQSGKGADFDVFTDLGSDNVCKRVDVCSGRNLRIFNHAVRSDLNTVA